MNIVAMSRVKNESRWIKSVVESWLSVADRAYVFDDHSTDGTAEILDSMPRVERIPSPFEGLDEARDKNHLIAHVEKRTAAPAFLLHLDGDEELAPGSADTLRKLATPFGSDTVRFQIVYLWDSPDQVRVDGIYGRFRRPSFFRLTRGRRFSSTVAGGFHCGNVPEPDDVINADVKVLHYGYMHREDRIRKWEFYNSFDGTNRAEGYRPSHPHQRSYGHIVQGDIPEVPAGEKLIHAGPLDLRPLKELL